MRNPKSRDAIILVLVLLVTGYVAISVGVYLFQEELIFQPKKLERNYKFQFDQPFQEYYIPTKDGETLNALFFSASLPSKGFILYFHGNAGNLQRWGEYATDFTRLGYDILMIDYRGYGKSSGSPDEIKLYEDATTVLDWAKSNTPFSRLIIYGRSLGSAVATHLAVDHTPDLLILETPFDELKGVVFPPLQPVLTLFPQRYFFSNKQNIPKIKCKKVIFHGTDDWVVPLYSAKKLKPLLGKDDSFFIIDGGSHRNLRSFPEYHRLLAETLNSQASSY